uniref:Uncharacterized protein n=1 Tax=Anguilla anguilla TaxID=7936 RepID=A0A0E9UYV6_ANGAN
MFNATKVGDKEKLTKSCTKRFYTALETHLSQDRKKSRP